MFSRSVRSVVLAICLWLVPTVPTANAVTMNFVSGWNLVGAGANVHISVADTFGDAAMVTSVWKWIPENGRWAFYSPAQSDGGAAYAAGKGYEFLTAVNGGEGFWVNAKVPFSAELPAGALVSSTVFQPQFDGSGVLVPGWNLIAIGDNKTPSAFNRAIGFSPPAADEVALNMITLWAWDAVLGNWYFYSPLLERNGTLKDYTQQKGYLDFGTRVLDSTTGFWVNSNRTAVQLASYLLGINRDGNGNGSVSVDPVQSSYPSGSVATLTATPSAGSTFAGWSGACMGTASVCAITMNATRWVTATFTASTPSGGSGGAAAPAVEVPTGTSPVTLNAATPPAVFAALTPAVTVGAVSISSAPTVSFSLTDGNGNAIIGFGSRSQSATATVASRPNIAFSLAKLVPGSNGAPGKWVSYIVTTVPTTTAASVPARPTTDNTGTLVDHGNGTYTYTFYRDITKVKDAVAAAALTAPNVAADLGDLTFEPNLVHRLTIQISGNAPGTGTNTPNAVQVTTGVPMANPINVIFDFVPATGKTVTATDPSRDIVATANCNECHGRLGGIPGSAPAIHGGARNDARYCVVCHTDQRKYGQARVTSTALSFPALSEIASIDATTGRTYYSYSPSTYVADDEVLGNFTTMVHKIHQGKELVKQNYNYANVVFNYKGYSMLGGGQKMCSKCHDNTKAAQADNWNKVPSRLACGACHDGIDFATGTGTTLAGATTGHVGKGQSNDATCALCHAPADIKTYHQTGNITPHNPTIAAGLKTFAYEIKSAAVDAISNNVTVIFKINADGTALATLAPTGFTGSPAFLLAWTVAQDGIATPVDYNNTTRKQAQAISVSIASLLLGTGGSIAGPDASGYFTATLSGIAGTNVFPLGARMRTVALQGYYTQAAGTGGIAAATARYAKSVVKTVTGDTQRRIVVDPAKCSSCHEWFEGHGGNRVYETQVCVMCHVPGLATSARGISDAAFDAYTGFAASDNKKLSDWGFDKTRTNKALQFPVTSNAFKDLVHGIHKGQERVTPFVDARDRTPAAITLLDFRRMNFPGVLQNCETCHFPGTYSNVPTTALASTYESIDAAYAAAIAGGTQTPALAKTALNQANSNDKVTSPITGACISCHDSAAAQGHMATQGGAIMVSRSTFAANIATPGKGEACATCHGAGKSVDIATIHKK